MMWQCVFVLVISGLSIGNAGDVEQGEKCEWQHFYSACKGYSWKNGPGCVSNQCACYEEYGDEKPRLCPKPTCNALTRVIQWRTDCVIKGVIDQGTQTVVCSTSTDCEGSKMGADGQMTEGWTTEANYEFCGKNYGKDSGKAISDMKAMVTDLKNNLLKWANPANTHYSGHDDMPCKTFPETALKGIKSYVESASDKLCPWHRQGASACPESTYIGIARNRVGGFTKWKMPNIKWKWDAKKLPQAETTDGSNSMRFIKSDSATPGGKKETHLASGLSDNNRLRFKSGR